MDELIILRAAMKDIAASGSEKANIALVLAEQVRVPVAVTNQATADMVKNTAEQIANIVQSMNRHITAGVSEITKGYQSSAIASLEKIREAANQISLILIKGQK